MSLAQILVLAAVAVLVVFLLAKAILDRGPVNHAPCDCPGCEIRFRPRNLPLKPERDRLAKGGHRAL
jgi:hypothetical protein